MCFRCLRRRKFGRRYIEQNLEVDENDVDDVVIIPPEPEENITDEDEKGSSVPSDVPGKIEVDHSAA